MSIGMSSTPLYSVNCGRDLVEHINESAIKLFVAPFTASLIRGTSDEPSVRCHIRHPSYTRSVFTVVGLAFSHLTAGSLAVECSVLRPIGSLSLCTAWWRWTLLQ
ncbi:hypothetical protein HD554DRAFT_1478355 [Boletus coccyginus]|nr:hypothetical protein HD554DRAFT_1478355 [Boletus coccyginus]